MLLNCIFFLTCRLMSHVHTPHTHLFTHIHTCTHTHTPRLQVWLVGVSGAVAGLSKMGEEWVREIYAHQMHRLLSSTGPLRGLSSIGAGIHGLLLVPVQVGGGEACCCLLM